MCRKVDYDRLQRPVQRAVSVRKRKEEQAVLRREGYRSGTGGG